MLLLIELCQKLSLQQEQCIEVYSSVPVCQGGGWNKQGGGQIFAKKIAWGETGI